MRVAFVVTTHHDNYVVASTTMTHLLAVVECLPLEPRIYLFLNEPSPATLTLVDDFAGWPWIESEVVENQRGGLTYTWNAGIVKGMDAGCDVFVLLNDDARVNGSLCDLILAASSPTDLAICGPGTTPEGAPYNPESWVYMHHQGVAPKMERQEMRQWHGLNGFCMAFHRTLLQTNTLDGLHCFDPQIPFGGNETEFGKRWYLQGGKCAIVYSAFVDHLKHSSWRRLPGRARAAVKVEPPPLLEDPAPHERPEKVAVLTYAVLESYADDLPLVESGQGVTYMVLVAGLTKHTRLPKLCKGWLVAGQHNRAWNRRLRLKHLLDMWPRLRCSSLFVLEEPKALAVDPGFMGGAVLPPHSPALGVLPLHPLFPTLVSRHAAKAHLNGPMMARFPLSEPCLAPSFSLYPSVWRHTKDTRDFLASIFDMGRYVDWDFEFLVSWGSHETGIELGRLDPLWAHRMFS